MWAAGKNSLVAQRIEGGKYWPIEISQSEVKFDVIIHRAAGDLKSSKVKRILRVPFLKVFKKLKFSLTSLK